MDSSIILELEEHGLWPHEKSNKDYDFLGDLEKVLNDNNYKSNKPERLLGIDWNSRDRKSIKANYYVGYKWIVEGKSAVHVRPKIENLDLVKLFMHCFTSTDAGLNEAFSKIYHIDFNQQAISVDSSQVILTPMLIVHFLNLTKRIVQKGLKCNYKQIEENLKCKVKGKILFSQHIKRNIVVGRTDRTMCRYQEYSVDCLENRILKKTLLFVQSYLNNHPSLSCISDLKKILSFCLGAMNEVSEFISLRELKHYKVNPLYKEYADALKVAKLILKRFSYDIQTTQKETENKIPPFAINMPILFELYVYSLLKRKYSKEIAYHISTYGNELDFVKYDEQLIIDTKYMTSWEDRVNHKNIRQLSGYARNKAIREKIFRKGDFTEEKKESKILDCLFIYPKIETKGLSHDLMKDIDEKESFQNEQKLEKERKWICDFSGLEKLVSDDYIIPTYIHFYKLPIELPTIESNSQE